MKRFLLATVTFALTGALVAVAQDPKPAQPAQPAQPKAVARPIQIQPAQPGVGRALPVTAARLATLEEELETLEVQRDIRRGHLTAAEVGVKMADVTAKRAKLFFEKGGTTREDVEKAQLEVEAAKAQLDIRAAEIKEVEVKIKYAKKRLDEAKAGPVRPAPGVRPVDPKPVDPPPAGNPARATANFATPALELLDEKDIAALKKQIEELTVSVAAKKDAAAKAATEAKTAADEHAKILDIAMRGRVLPGTIEKAEAKAKAAKAAAEIAAAVVEKTEAELKAAKLKLELLGK